MANGAISGQQQQLMRPNDTDNGRVDSEAPLDFSVKRPRTDHVIPSQTAMTSFPVVAPPVLLPMLDPSAAVMSALSAAGLLLRAPGPPAISGSPNPVPPAAAAAPVYRMPPTACSGDVTEQLRAYVRSKIAEEQRLLTTAASSSSSASPPVDCSSIERTAASPVRSSPTSTTTSPARFDLVPPPSWQPPPVVSPPGIAELELSAAVAGATSRKRGYSCPDTSSSSATKDLHYWERRRKNNEAAKRSRDARRAKEDEVAMRATVLEQENRQLRVELTAFRLEVARLSELLCRQVAAQRASTLSTASVPTTSSQENSSR